MKSCADISAPVISTLANRSLESGNLLQERSNVTAAKDGRARKLIAGELQTYVVHVYILQGS